MNFPQPPQPPQPPPTQHNQPIQPPQPVIQRNSQQSTNEIQRTQTPIPIINPNIQYPRYPQQVHPQPKINQKAQSNRRKNQKTSFPQPFPNVVNPQPSVDFSQPQLKMNFLKAQELLPDRRELFFELIKEFPNNQQQYYQILNELMIKFADDNVYRYFREPRVPRVFKAITAIKPTYYLATFSSQKEFKPQPKDRTPDVLYIASYVAFQADPSIIKMMNLFVNNSNLTPLSFGEPDEAPFFRLGTGDKVPPSMILNTARVSYNILYWLVVQAVRLKSPEEFINEYYSSKVKNISPLPQKLISKCQFCNNFYDAFSLIRDIQRRGDSICPTCGKRIPNNQFIFDNQSIHDESPEKKKYRIQLFDIMHQPFLKKFMKFDDQVCNSVFNYDPNQSILNNNLEKADESGMGNDLDNLNDYICSMINSFGDNAFE